MIEAIRTRLRAHRARRRARLAEWRAGWSADLNAPGARDQARKDMLWNDHGVLRALWHNEHEIAPGIWRGNQPSPERVADLAKRGFKSALNLRGPNQWGSYLLEAEACAAHGLTLINGRVYSNKAPMPEEITRVLAQIEAAEKPLYIHCKSGADRAGIASALYLLSQGRPAAEAARQLSLRHAHLSFNRTGILDAFIAAFGREQAGQNRPFLAWVEQVYDPVELQRKFDETRLSSRLFDTLLARE